MKDGSRILVVRPPFPNHGLFVRKFYIKNVNLNMLIRDENAHLPINLIKYIVKGGMITSITGQQEAEKPQCLWP